MSEAENTQLIAPPFSFYLSLCVTSLMSRLRSRRTLLACLMLFTLRCSGLHSLRQFCVFVPSKSWGGLVDDGSIDPQRSEIETQTHKKNQDLNIAPETRRWRKRSLLDNLPCTPQHQHQNGSSKVQPVRGGARLHATSAIQSSSLTHPRSPFAEDMA